MRGLRCVNFLCLWHTPCSLMDISNAGLIRRAARTDPGAALVPYTLWCAFATVLNADIVRRNHPLR